MYIYINIRMYVYVCMHRCVCTEMCLYISQPHRLKCKEIDFIYYKQVAFSMSEEGENVTNLSPVLNEQSVNEHIRFFHTHIVFLHKIDK